MVKKEDNTIWIVILVGIVLLIIFYPKPNLIITQTNENTESTQSETNSPASIESPSTNNINLCNLLTPYVILFNLQTQCQLNGGTWTCSDHNIGCYSMNSSVLDCDLIPIQTALSQCRSAEGTAYCDPMNVYCRR